MIKPAFPPPGRRPPVVSDRMRISVEPAYSHGHSTPPDRHVFAYFVRIENVGNQPAQLYWRHWKIHDPVAGDQEVEGEGVVGESPMLEPGDVHEYCSYCILESRNGHMEGFYHFRERDGTAFRAEIPRFFLQVPLGTGGPVA